MNNTIEKFFNNLVECLKDYNDSVNEELDDEKKVINIPFLIAPLYQAMGEIKYKEFLLDLEKYSDYSIEYIKDDNGYYSNGSVIIRLAIWNGTDESFNDYDFPNYDYKIDFKYNPKGWGYCGCSPEDKDYREDKCCCGHGCDWWAPSFTLNKIVLIGSHNWNGDEHDYWDFEDKFYKDKKKLVEQKEKEDREYNIKNLKEQIAKIQEELEKLEE